MIPTSSGSGPATVREVLAAAGSVLAAAGVEDPARDARLLLGAVTGRDPWLLGVGSDRLPTAAQAREFARLVSARAARCPLAYLLGEWGFHEIVLKVDGRALVPRPETELLVEEGLNAGGDRAFTALDVGCGGGAVALALAAASSGRVFASDLDPGAVALARQNAGLLGLEDRVEIRCGDLFAPWTEYAGHGFDLVLSNPPYVADDEWGQLAPEIREYEPALALRGGGDGLAVIRRLAAGVCGYLAPGGCCLIEIGSGQGPAAADLFRSLPEMAEVSVVPDLAGRDRVVRARRRG